VPSSSPSDRVVDLPDGTAVGLYEYGDPAGAPVFAFHGVPSCGAGFDFTDEPARARGLHVLAPDRPRIGRSSGPALRSAGDYPTRIALLADTLEIDRFAVLGYSGGGPYAVACAAELVERVTATAVAAGMGQVGVWAEVNDFAKTDRQFLDLAVHHPRLSRFLLASSAFFAKRSPKSAMRSFAKELGESDRAAVADDDRPPAEVMRLFTLAFQNGAQGVVDDYRTIARPWDVTVGATGPVTIWQGDADTMVPLHHAEALHDALPGSTLTVWPGEGHLGPITHIDEILDALT
jgi:pimeloyl-ACP methyl ester carboxylesterase